MKKIFLSFLIILLSFNYTYAYELTEKENNIIKGVKDKLNQLSNEKSLSWYKNNLEKFNKIIEVNKDNERIKTILTEVTNEIQKIITSHFQDDDTVESILKELENFSGIYNDKVDTNDDEILDDKISEDDKIEKKDETKKSNNNKKESYYKIDSPTNDNFLEIAPIDNIKNIQTNFLINGKVNNKDIDKITVSFKNKDSSFPRDDKYELKKFLKGDKKFIYNADKNFEVLDYGLNEYLIEGYKGKNVIKQIKLKVYISNSDDSTKVSEEEVKEINEKYKDKKINEILPEFSTDFGDLTKINDNEFTYSLINNLNFTKDTKNTLYNCKEIGNYLNKKDSWYFFNECGELNKNQGISLYTLIIDKDFKYSYNKEYFDKNLGIIGIINLEKGTIKVGEDFEEKKKNMEDKNEELKLKKYQEVKQSDKLFKFLNENY